ncbi:hypothetical protein [Acaryochloris sp. IP29b_bin.148]|uniref:hypothetical protein n=1 Tax=Acaryochloris sp. IP29b_bin.148 TaxID=2969218 RepID=UPI00261FBB45|nr:hypothetical protein [Acaryochloris sp. IP29b_bin.148]
MKAKKIVGVSSAIIAVIGVVATITVPEIRCYFRLDSGQVCSSGFVEVELVVRNKKYEPIQGVEVRFLAQGAPEVKYTDSNGFSNIQIPAREDIEVTLIQDGFETLNQVVNVGNSPDDRTRTFQLKETSLEDQPTPDPLISDVSPTRSAPVSTSPQDTAVIQVVEDNDYRTKLQGCKRSNENIKCDLLITNLLKKDRYFRLWTRESRMISDAGDEFIPKEVQIGIKSGNFNSGNTLVSSIPVKGSITFEGVSRKINNFSLLELKYDGAGRDPAGKIKILNIKIN